jgi:hypothetical protein
MQNFGWEICYNHETYEGLEEIIGQAKAKPPIPYSGYVVFFSNVHKMNA